MKCTPKMWYYINCRGIEKSREPDAVCIGPKDRSFRLPGNAAFLRTLGGEVPRVFSIPQKQKTPLQIKFQYVIFMDEYLVANMTILEYNIIKGRCDYVKF